MVFEKSETVEPEPVHSTPNQTSVDWIAAGCVNSIQDQGQCGSCWAFAAAAAMESSHCIDYSGFLYKLSEQNFVSCAGFRYGNYGCNGGLASNAWRYAQ